MRYRGQSFELTVRDVDAEYEGHPPRRLEEAIHEDRYGYKDPEGEIEVVTIREHHSEPGPEVEFAGDEAEDVARGRPSSPLPEATLVVPEELGRLDRQRPAPDRPHVGSAEDDVASCLSHVITDPR